MTTTVVNRFNDTSINSRNTILAINGSAIVFVNTVETADNKNIIIDTQRIVATTGDIILGVPVVDSDPEWLAREKELLNWIDMPREEFLQMGVDKGWWMSFDETRMEPIPFPLIFVMETRELRKNFCGLWETVLTLEPSDTTMAHILGNSGIFNSVGDAKKNGWKKPIAAGTFKFKKANVTLEVVED
jgi:hypothetical protein